MSDLSKGFNVTLGIVLALVVVFVVLPAGACCGFAMIGSGSLGAAKAEAEAELEELGAEVLVTDLQFKVVQATKYRTEATYKFTGTNNRDRAQTVTFRATFKSADGFVVLEDAIRSQHLAPGEVREFSAARPISATQGEEIERLTVVAQ